MKDTATSDISTIANFVKVCVGAGVLAIPAAAYGAGILPTIICGVIAVVWITICQHRLLSCQTDSWFFGPDPEKDPWITLMDKTFPKFGTLIMGAIYVVTLFGSGLTYVITFEKTLSGYLWKKVGFTLGRDPKLWAGVFFVITLPLVLFRSLSSLSIVSIVGSAIFIVSCIVVLIYGDITYGWDNVDELTFNFGNIFNYASIWGTMCFCLCVAFIAPSARNNMKNTNHFDWVLGGSLAGCVIFYVIFAAFAIIFFSNDAFGIYDMILQNIQCTTIYYYISSACIAIVCWLSYPITVYPAMKAIELWIDSNETKFFVTDYKRILMRAGSLAAVCIMAAFLPYLGEKYKDKKDMIIDLVLIGLGALVTVGSTVWLFVSKVASSI
ncbi:hypothetical protein WA158_006041 [Blastocystis sp. Blastoise]